jgi:hypothetical protein
MAETEYHVVREATLREVLEHFLRTETMRPKYAGQREEFARWLPLDDLAFIQCVREFAASRDDVNPVLTWTVGTPGNTHHERVAHWVLARVPIAVLYSCGINLTTQADLDAARGNLARFSKFAHNHPEFRMDSVPAGDQAIIIAVARQSPD